MIFDQEDTYKIPRQGRRGKVGIIEIPTNPNCLEVSTRKEIASGHAMLDKNGWGNKREQ